VPPERIRALQLLAGQAENVLELRLHSARAHAELDRAQERLASFAGQLSHDLKAPITAVLGFSELLAELDAVAADETARGYVARCVSAARRMQATIDELLAFARIAAAEAIQPVALDTIVPEALEDLGEAARSARVSWSGPDMLGDPGQLRALLCHLLGNAISYRGDAPCVVTVSTERTEGGLVLRIADNGPGIPPESRNDVVRPLVRLRTDVPGAGLGLAVCARIATVHGGSLTVGETPGGGTTVTVDLPE
jgi:signal transduction histidine kinase